MSSGVRYNVHARINEDGTALGWVRLDFDGQFVTDLWYLYAEEFIADEIVLFAEITSGEVLADGGVRLVGLTQEYNFDVRRNILFSACDHLGCNEPRTPFVLIIGGSLGSAGMSVDWCEYPGPFSLKAKGGKVNINTGGQASPLQSAEFAQSEGAASGCRQ